MVIGFLSLEIYLPYSHSLKEKRKTIVSLKDRVKKKYNVAFAELDYHDKWQRSKIGIVTLNNQKTMIESIFRSIGNGHLYFKPGSEYSRTDSPNLRIIADSDTLT